MTEHELCGKRHSRDELVAKCEARHEARADDAKRRERNAKLIPYPEKIRNRMGAHGISADKVAAEMKRDYNPPPAHLVRSQDGWTVWSVIQVYSEQLNWPGVDDRLVAYFEGTGPPCLLEQQCDDDLYLEYLRQTTEGLYSSVESGEAIGDTC